MMAVAKYQSILSKVEMSLKYVRNGPIYHDPALVHIMACDNDDLVWWRIYASLGLSEVIK